MHSTLLRVAEGRPEGLWISLVYPNLDWDDLGRNLWSGVRRKYTGGRCTPRKSLYPGIEPAMISSFISKRTFREHSTPTVPIYIYQYTNIPCNNSYTNKQQQQRAQTGWYRRGGTVVTELPRMERLCLRSILFRNDI